MKIRMRIQISGTRSGVEWPPLGGILEVDDEEGRHLVEGGMAEPVTDFRDAETAVVPKAEERSKESKPKEPEPGLTTKNAPTKTPVQKKSVSNPKEG